MAEPVFNEPDAGGRMGNPVGGEVVFKIRGEQTGGSMTAFETFVAPGAGPPLHTHAHEDETLYVIEGDLRFKLGDELKRGSRGSLVFVPRGTPHTFQNEGDRTARMLIHFTPSGMERFFDDFAGLDAADFATVAARVDMAVVGPPLAQSDPL